MRKGLRMIVDDAEAALNRHDAVITEYDLAVEKLKNATARLDVLEAQRAIRKQTAIVRICATNNEASGKPFTQSQANDFAQLDEDYAAYKAKCADAVAAKELAEREVERALLRASSTFLAGLLNAAIVFTYREQS